MSFFSFIGVYLRFLVCRVIAFYDFCLLRVFYFFDTVYLLFLEYNARDLHNLHMTLKLTLIIIIHVLHMVQH
jgi:hypothetical protein